MSQYRIGTVSVTNGSPIVAGVGTAFLANVAAGDVFIIRGAKVPYIVGSIQSDTQLTLSSNYADVTASGLIYSITTSFTPVTGIPYIEQGDVDTATIFKRAMLKLDALLSTAAITGGVIAGVALTGSTIDSTVIGGMTAAAATFTQSTVRGVNGTNAYQVKNTAGNTVAALLPGTNGNGRLQLNDASGNLQLVLSANGFSYHTGRLALGGSVDDGSSVLAVTGPGKITGLLTASGGVAITGGTLDGVTIGGTTPGAITGTNGAFTQSQASGNGSWGVKAVGGNGAARDIALFGQSGFSNGLTVQYNGTNMIYQLRDGRTLLNGATDDGVNALQVAGGVTGTTGTFNGAVKINGNYQFGPDTGRYSASALRLQNMVANQFSGLTILPNGTSNNSFLRFYNGSDPLNTGSVEFDVIGNQFSLTPSTWGTGTVVTSYAMNGLRLLLGTATDDGVNVLQVVGGGKFTGSLVTGGIGASGLSGDVTIARNATPNKGYIYFGNSGVQYFGFDGTNYAFGQGRTLINGATDDGVNALQVAGSIISTGKLWASAPGATNASGYGNTNQLAAPLGAVALFIGNGNDTSGLTASQYSNAIRFNGAGCYWGDISYYPKAALSGGGPAFKFTAAGAAVEGGTYASVGMGTLYSAKVLVNGATDNGTDALQVNGSIRASQIAFSGNGYGILANGNNIISINAHFTPTSNNGAELGQSALRWNAVWSSNGTIQTSDARLKTDITDSALGLDFINQLRPVSYEWRENANGTHYGLIAQEVDALLQRMGVKSFAGLEKPESGFMGLNYAEFIAPLIRSVQELSAKVDRLESQLAAA